MSCWVFSCICFSCVSLSSIYFSVRIICVLAFSFCLSNSYSIFLQIFKNCNDLVNSTSIFRTEFFFFSPLSKNICITSNEFVIAFLDFPSKRPLESS